MEIVKTCEWCRKVYSSKRAHSTFCCTNCRTQSHRILKEYRVLAKWVDEKTVKEKYYVQQEDICVLYLLWFRVKQDNGKYERFADVYINEGCSIEAEKKMLRRKLKFGIRYTQ